MIRSLMLPRVLILTTLALLLAACTGAMPSATPPPMTPTTTVAPSTMWFPATNTPTALPTSALPPTPEALPGIGVLLFEDDFSDSSLWNIATSERASAQLENSRLTLSLNAGPLSIVSLRSEPTLGDLYAVVTAQTSLCRGRDQYGVVYHAASSNTYYRFLLSCDGNLRLERVRSGTADILQNWIPSGDAPPGAPAEVRIGIWVSGTEMRFLLNDRFQFSIRDPVLRSGSLGFFAYASGTTPVIVSFSRLEVYAVAYISPTPTLTPTRTPIP